MFSLFNRPGVAGAVLKNFFVITLTTHKYWHIKKVSHFLTHSKFHKSWIEFLYDSLQGTVTPNIFSLKSGPKGCKDLWNNNDLQN